MSVKSPRRAFSGLVAIAVAMAVAACGGQPGGVGESEGDTRLDIGVSTIPTTLDPGQQGAVEEIAIMHLALGTLTDQDADGKAVSMGLAASVEPGDGRYLIELKPDLKFSDGSALTATDVVASFEYYLADETNFYAYAFEPIDKVAAVDELTVEFDLNKPYPSLPFVLAYHVASIIPSEVIEDRGPGELYTGDPLPTAGPFQIESLEQNQITLTANPNYAGEQPSTKTVVFKKVSDPAARLAQVQGGEIDFAAGVSPKQVGDLSGSVEVSATRSVNGAYFVGMNNRENSLLSDVRIRQAIARAIDRDQINELAYGGQSQPVLGLFSNSSQYSDPFLPATPDIAGAKALLTGTACENSCTLRYLTAHDDVAYNDTAVIVQQNLRAIGIDVTIEQVEKAVTFDYATEGNYDLRSVALYDVADYPDSYVSFLLGPGIEALWTGYSNPEIHEQIDIVTTAAEPARDAAIGRIKEIFEEDVPLAPIADFLVVSASRVPSEKFDVEPTLYYHVG